MCAVVIVIKSLFCLYFVFTFTIYALSVHIYGLNVLDVHIYGLNVQFTRCQCKVKLCNAMLSYAKLCNAMLSLAKPSYAIYYIMLNYA